MCEVLHFGSMPASTKFTCFISFLKRYIPKNISDSDMNEIV